ncbi:MAG TPA: hypothetical protein VJZ71_00390 [Phycisphaerae bacterium]|nr:hypothetical protein [Phycisphaerae bacterium]
MLDQWSRTLKSLCIIFVFLSGCDVWRPPTPTEAELDKGLVVMYPGSFNTTIEMLGFYEGLRQGGVDEAIELVQWAAFLDHYYDPTGAQVRNDERARQEAARFAAYKQAHPDRPVTLLGYSGGAWFAILVAERMPEGTQVDRLILMSAAMHRSYDVSAALAGTREEIVLFWSPRDQFTQDRGVEENLADSTHGPPAASFGFDMQDERLMQIEYDPAWEQYGHYGEHADYLPLVGWIGQFVAPWVAKAPDAGAATRRIPDGY